MSNVTASEGPIIAAVLGMSHCNKDLMQYALLQPNKGRVHHVISARDATDKPLRNHHFNHRNHQDGPHNVSAFNAVLGEPRHGLSTEPNKGSLCNVVSTSIANHEPLHDHTIHHRNHQESPGLRDPQAEPFTVSKHQLLQNIDDAEKPAFKKQKTELHVLTADDTIEEDLEEDTDEEPATSTKRQSRVGSLYQVDCLPSPCQALSFSDEENGEIMWDPVVADQAKTAGHCFYSFLDGQNFHLPSKMLRMEAVHNAGYDPSKATAELICLVNDERSHGLDPDIQLSEEEQEKLENLLRSQPNRDFYALSEELGLNMDAVLTWYYAWKGGKNWKVAWKGGKFIQKK